MLIPPKAETRSTSLSTMPPAAGRHDPGAPDLRAALRSTREEWVPVPLLIWCTDLPTPAMSRRPIVPPAGYTRPMSTAIPPRS